MKRITMVFAVVLALAALASIGCGKKAPPFNLTVDTVTVDGTVADTFDTDPEMALDGTPLTVTAGAFTAVCDTSVKNTYSLTADDDVSNTTSLTVRVQ